MTATHYRKPNEIGLLLLPQPPPLNAIKKMPVKSLQLNRIQIFFLFMGVFFLNF